MSGNVDDYVGLTEYDGYHDLLYITSSSECKNNDQCARCMRQLKCPYKKLQIQHNQKSERNKRRTQFTTMDVQR